MAMPPNMFEHPEAFTQPEVEAAEAVEAEEAEHQHEHGPECGHEAVEHDGHLDYIVDGKRHWWNRDRWEHHDE
jgi:zinc transport system permease protein